MLPMIMLLKYSSVNQNILFILSIQLGVTITVHYFGRVERLRTRFLERMEHVKFRQQLTINNISM